MKNLNLICFESKSGNFIAMKSTTTFEVGKNPVKNYYYYWFSADGAFLRPAIFSEWEYANGWGQATKKAFACPTQDFTHENAVINCNGKQWVICASNSIGYKVFEVTPTELVIVEKLVAGGSFAFGGSLFWLGTAFGDSITESEVVEIGEILDWTMDNYDNDGNWLSQKPTTGVEILPHLQDMG